MSIVQSFKLALGSIIDNKLRSFLTMLGMIIGVASVVALVSLMQGMTSYIADSFADMGVDQITVSVTNTETRNVTIDGMYEFYEENTDLFTGVSPTVSVYQANVKKGGETSSYTTVTGVAESYQTIAKLELSSGRFLSYSDILSRSNVCIVGSYIVQSLFGTDDVLGETLKIKNQTYTIIGVLEEVADSEERSSDDVIYLSYSNAMKLNQINKAATYVFAVLNTDNAPEAKTKIETYLYEIFKDEDLYYVMSMSEIIEMLNEQMGLMTALLVGIAAISLLVAGIGIMNIMLVTVTERKTEIGIRKSLGAKKKDIMSQFVIEAGLTSTIGGVIGIIIGGVATTALGDLIGLPASPSFAAVAVSFGVSVGIGVLFGYMPAGKAAKLNPIDALRSD